jgi:hypothetical protein
MVRAGQQSGRGKLRSLIERIINGKAEQNPATWERLKGADGLHGKTAETTHHRSMPYAEVPAFVRGRITLGAKVNSVLAAKQRRAASVGYR